MMPHEKQFDRMLAALRQVPRDEWGRVLAHMLFVACCDPEQPPAVTADQMSEIAHRILAHAEMFRPKSDAP